MGTNATLLKVDAVYLVTAAIIAFLMNALGRPIAGVGFVDAHELALIAGLLLWCPAPRRCWHLAAAAVHMLFAAANIAHWQTFVASGIASVGLTLTAVHLVFAVLQSVAARASDAPRELVAEPA